MLFLKTFKDVNDDRTINIIVVIVVIIIYNYCWPMAGKRTFSRGVWWLSLRVTYGRGSVFLWQRCDMLCTSAFTDDVMFSHNRRRE